MSIWSWIFRLALIILVIYLIICFFKKRKKYRFKAVTQIFDDDSQIPFLQKSVKRERRPKRENKTENECRKILERIYNRPFPTIRPNFLKSPRTKKNLELDCYNEDLKIAIEYNGRQHYQYSPVFHRKKKDFYTQVHNDDYKRKKCRQLGIRLIEIPYWITTPNLEKYIVGELKKKGCL